MRTVIVRLFEAAPDTGPVGMRGIVEDVARGTSEPFNGPLELLDAVERAADHASEASGSPAAPPRRELGAERETGPLTEL